MNNVVNLTKMSFFNLKSIFKQVILVLFVWTAIAIYNPYFLNILFAFIILMTLYQAMIYEDMNGINNLISVLPVKKIEYVISRYLFGFIILLLTGIFMILVYNIGNKINPGELPLKVLLGTGVTSAIFAMALIIPTVLKFGANKMRIAMAIIMMIIFSITAATIEILNKEPEIMGKIINIMDTVGISSILVILNMLVLLVSMMISIKVYKNKEVKK